MLECPTLTLTPKARQFFYSPPAKITPSYSSNHGYLRKTTITSYILRIKVRVTNRIYLSLVNPYVQGVIISYNILICFSLALGCKKG